MFAADWASHGGYKNFGKGGREGGRGESTVLERVGHKKVYLLTNTIF